MPHKQIKKFEVGIEFLDDSDIIRIKNQYENLLTTKMRDSGYTRVLDIDPSFSIEFNGETWKMSMAIYGVYVGKRKAWGLEGISQWKQIPRTHRHKLNQ